MPQLVGAALEVPLATGGRTRYLNLDCAASTPAMETVADAVNEALQWYSSVHRGAGFASQVSTRLYEAARETIAEFIGARPTDTVVFVRNTTDAINHLARCLPIAPGHVVVTTAIEHHANLLPWRRAAPVVHIPVPASPDDLVREITAVLSDPAHTVALVAITGASNVTGEVLPLAAIADAVHAAGALLCVDAAQLAPHRSIDMGAMGIDCLALSGHKMYAPFGTGVLVAPAELLRNAEPVIAGGGAVEFVTLDEVIWTHLPDRLEAGSPNVIGAIALGAAASALQQVGMDQVAAHEQMLLGRLDAKLAGLTRMRRLQMWPGPGVDRLGVATFLVEDMHHALLAAALSAEYGIGVRHGCFCAHPLIAHLLGMTEADTHDIRAGIARGERARIPGAVRASFGVGTTTADIDRFADAVTELVTRGPALQYVQDPLTGDYTLPDDRRTWPVLKYLRVDGDPGHGTGCGQF